VRPPLSSVMSRSAATFTRSVPPLRPDDPLRGFITGPPHVPDPPDDEPQVIQEHEQGLMQETEESGAAVSAAAAEGATSERFEDVPVPVAVVAASESEPDDVQPTSDSVEAPLFRRQLIRAALPRPEGATPPTRVIPEFTIRQPMGRNRHGGGGGRRRGNAQGQGQGFNGPMRFGRDASGQRSNGHGRPGGHGRPNGHGGQGGHGNHGGPTPSAGSGRGGNRSRGPRRGGKKR
jgi:hypothetical protein